MPLIKDIKAGSDPEVFLVDETGKFVPSFDLIGGTKHEPKPMGKPGFFVQEDNVALEFNIPPSLTEDEFVFNIHEGLRLAKEMIPKGFDIRIQASTRFTPEQLLHPSANVFGCDRDMNAWTGDFNMPPSVPPDGLRATGGHFHLGYTVCDFSGPYMSVINRELAKLFDVYLTVPFMEIDHDLDRRKIYGKAGAYRDKLYGMEYRSLSSKWLESQELTRWVHKQAMKAVAIVNEGVRVDPQDQKRVLAAINANNKKAQDYIVKKYNVAS